MKPLKNFSRKLSLLGRLWQSKSISRIFRYNILVIIIQIVFLTIKFSDLPQQVPLFYSRPWGESRLASAPTLFILPSFSTILFLSNSLLAAAFLDTIPLFSHLLTVFSFLFSSFSLISLVKIIFLVS